MKESTKTALAVVAVLGIAIAFWLVLLAPKRDEASELGDQVTRVESEVSAEQARAESSLVAKRSYSSDYAQLVGLGKAVPAEAATPSLLVQVQGLSLASKTDFNGISGAGGEESAPVEAVATEPTEDLAPIGATPGPAGLLKMPYTLEFNGEFFDIAKFIEGVDSLVSTKEGKVRADGRLMTIDGFQLNSAAEEGAEGKEPSSLLAAKFNVTTYVTPPGQGLTSGGTSAGPAEETVAEVP
jgi:Tfp pilus assembly protein PilO